MHTWVDGVCVWVCVGGWVVGVPESEYASITSDQLHI